MMWKRSRIIFYSGIQMVSYFVFFKGNSERFFFIWTLIALSMVLIRVSNCVRPGIPVDTGCNARSSGCITGGNNIRIEAMVGNRQRIDDMKKADERNGNDLLIFLVLNVLALLLTIK